MLCQHSVELQKHMSTSVDCNWCWEGWRRKMPSRELLVRCSGH